MSSILWHVIPSSCIAASQHRLAITLSLLRWLTRATCYSSIWRSACLCLYVCWFFGTQQLPDCGCGNNGAAV